MNSRQRIEAALQHRQPDYVPLDLGASPVSGMHVGSIARLRQALGLDKPGTPVKVVEPYQMLGEIAPDLQDALGLDVVSLGGPRTMFGFENAGWKPWTLFDGTPVLVPGELQHRSGPQRRYPDVSRGRPLRAAQRTDAQGRLLLRLRHPPGAHRREPPRSADNMEEFGPIAAADLEYYAAEIKRLGGQSDRAILANFGGTAFGDIALVPAPWLKHPKGIRDVEEWYVSTAARFDYVYEVFQRQCEIGLENLAKIYDVVGDRVSVIMVTGTDFGTQSGLFISPASYRKLYQPFHRRVNDWIHEHTPWKTFIHSCGSVITLLPDLIEAGFDVLNPVQCSAVGMDPRVLKERFGGKLTFWGGGVDTQKTLPFGTPAEIRSQVKERIDIFNRGGGFVFNTVHNVQAATPTENLLALYEAVREARRS